ncbi:MAG: hypothetical protein R2874_02845 [Desulfobacterales bacterium]
MSYRKTEKRKNSETDQLQLCLFDEPEILKPEKADTITVLKHTCKKNEVVSRFQRSATLTLSMISMNLKRVCACGCQLSRIGQKNLASWISFRQKMQVIRHIRYKYACKNCEGVEDDGPTVKTASLPIQFILKGIATPWAWLLIFLLVNMKMRYRFTVRKNI